MYKTSLVQWGAWKAGRMRRRSAGLITGRWWWRRVRRWSRWMKRGSQWGFVWMLGVEMVDTKVEANQKTTIELSLKYMSNIFSECEVNWKQTYVDISDPFVRCFVQFNFSVKDIATWFQLGDVSLLWWLRKALYRRKWIKELWAPDELNYQLFLNYSEVSLLSKSALWETSLEKTLS